MTSAIVSLADTKTELLITDTSHDAELQGWINAASDLVENIVGPVRDATFTAWHHGMTDTILLRRRPVTSITSVTEYSGTVSYPLTQQNPDSGNPLDAFGYFFDPDTASIQRTAYGVPSWFAALPWWSAKTPAWYTAGPQVRAGMGRVKVVYACGRATVPDHIAKGTLELVRHLWQTARGGRTVVNGPNFNDTPVVVLPSTYVIPNRVRELLEPTTLKGHL